MELGFPSRLDRKGIPGAGNSLCKGMAACLVQGLSSSQGAGPVSAGCARKKYPFRAFSGVRAKRGTRCTAPRAWLGQKAALAGRLPWECSLEFSVSMCGYPRDPTQELELFAKKRKGAMGDSQAVVPSPKQGPGRQRHRCPQHSSSEVQQSRLFI